METTESPTSEDFHQLAAETELNTPESFAHALIEYAVEVGANDIFVSDEDDATSIRFRQLGFLRAVRRLPRDYGRRLHNHFRAFADADLTDQHRPSSGRTVFELDDGRMIDLRVNAIPSLFGHDLAIRVAEQAKGVMTIDELGMMEDEVQQIRRLLDGGNGMILIGGPTASGKTHSLYAFLQYLNNGKRKIHTLEDPIERAVPGVVQSQVALRSHITFSVLLHAVLRHSPDVIMIGEIRDKETAEIALRAAASGQLVLATVHSMTAVGAIETMLAYQANPHFLASTLFGTIGQRLVRRLCQHCQEPIELPQESQTLAEVRHHIPSHPQPTLYRSGGCEWCGGTGFERLTCIPEILSVNTELRRMIAANRTGEELREAAIRNGMRTLRQAAQLRVAMGMVDPQDVSQMFPPDERI